MLVFNLILIDEILEVIVWCERLLGPILRTFLFVEVLGNIIVEFLFMILMFCWWSEMIATRSLGVMVGDGQRW